MVLEAALSFEGLHFAERRNRPSWLTLQTIRLLPSSALVAYQPLLLVYQLASRQS